MATSVFGGYANGAVMGGSVVGVIKDKAFDDNPPQQVANSGNASGDETTAAPPPASVADSR